MEITGCPASRLRVVRAAIVGSLLLIVSIATRFDSIIWPAEENWDESTLLLLARRAALGELPYTTTFDNKPPLAALLPTPVMTVTSNMVALRLYLAIVVALIALLVTYIPLRESQKYLSVPLGIGTILIINATEAGTSWMAQTSSMLLYAIFAALLLSDWPVKSSTRLTLAAFVLGLLPLTRTNWGLTSVLSFVVLLLMNGIRGVWSVILGFALPSMLVLAAYAAADELPALWKGAVELPLGYAQESTLSLLTVDFAWLASISFVLLSASSYLWWIAGNQKSARKILLINAGLVTLVVVQIWQRPDFDHHASQLAPFLGLGAASIIAGCPAIASKSPTGTSPFKRHPVSRRTPGMTPLTHQQTRLALQKCRTPVLIMTTVGFLLGLLALGRSPVPTPASIRTNAGTWGAQSAIVELVRESYVPKTSIWAITDHYVYTRADQTPVLPIVTHPSSVTKPSFRAAYEDEELSEILLVYRIMQDEPEVVIFNEDGAGYLNPVSLRFIGEELSKDFIRVTENAPVWLSKSAGREKVGGDTRTTDKGTSGMTWHP